MDAMIKGIEAAALAAWPALREEFYDDWVLRFSNGYTKRANSVNALGETPRLDLAEKVGFCEQVYQDAGLPAIFRITPLCPPDLDTYLDALDYRVFHPTMVMTLDLETWDSPADGLPALCESALDDWLEIYSDASGSPIEKSSTHREILAGIRSPCLYASLGGGESSPACGLGVLAGEFFGLFDILTRPESRNQGYATRLVVGMLAWAKERGALSAYLQVMEDNDPARHLYQKMGYQDFYKYWYRLPS